MYTSIRFATLQLHLGNDAEHNTLSKTIAVYENDLFVFDDKKLLHVGELSKEIKKELRKHYPKNQEQYSELLGQFTWYLN